MYVTIVRVTNIAICHNSGYINMPLKDEGARVHNHCYGIFEGVCLCSHCYGISSNTVAYSNTLNI